MADNSRSLGFNISTNEDLTRAAKAMELAVNSLERAVKKLDGMTARIKILADNAAANAALDETERKRKDLDGKSARVKVDIDKRSFADAANAWAMLSRNMRTLALPGAIALATPTVLALGQAAGVTSQSLLLLPAALGAAGAAAGTAKVAYGGLIQYFTATSEKKKQEAFNSLSESGKRLATTIDSLKPSFIGLRSAVQDAALGEFINQVKPLADTYLPVFRAGMVGVAGGMNEAALTIVNFVSQAQTVRDVQTIFENTAFTMHELSPAGAAILQILRDIAAVGSEFLPGLASGFTEVAQAAADFIARARESGKLREWISDGLSALGLLAQTFINVGGIISAIFRALRSDSDSFLTNIRDLTGRVSEFLNSGQGQQILVDVFNRLRDLASALMPLFGAIGMAVLQMFQQVAPALPPLVKGITDVFNASGSLLGVFRELLVAVLPPLGAALSALSPILGPLLIVITAVTAALQVYHTTLAIVETVTKAWAIAQAILNGTFFTFSTTIGIVVVAVVALAAALVYAYNHSETFRNFVNNAWISIRDAAVGAWEVLKAIFAAFSAALSAVGAVAQTVGQFFVDLWQNYIVPAWNGIVEVIKVAVAIILTVILAPFVIFFDNVLKPKFTELWQVVQVVWDGIKTAIKIACDFIIGVWNAVIGFIESVFKPAQVALQTHMSTVWTNIQTAINTVCQFLVNVWNSVINFLRTIFQPAISAFKDFFLLQFTMIRDGLAIIWYFIRDNLWNPMVNFVTQTIPDGFRRGVDAVRAVWNGIKAALRDPVQAAIDVVWNNGIVHVWNEIAGRVGIGGLNRYDLPGYATGGPIRGGTPGRDSVPFLGMPGEYVLSKPAVDAMGGPAAVDRMHTSLTGRPSGASMTPSGLPGYQAGGVLGDLLAIGEATWNAITGTVSTLSDRIGGTEWGRIIVGVGRKLTGAVVDYLKSKVAAAIAALTPAVGVIGAGGLPIYTGGGGARAWIIAHESGGNPRAQNPTSSASGLYQFIDSTWKAYGGSTAHAKDASVAEQNAVADRYVAARYGSWEGAVAFWQSHGWYDRGGFLPPGLSLAYNGTGQPERVLDPVQSRALTQLFGSTRGGGDLVIELRRVGAEIHALRGDVDHHGDQLTIAGEVRALRTQLAQGGASALADMAGARAVSVLGSF